MKLQDVVNLQDSVLVGVATHIYISNYYDLKQLGLDVQPYKVATEEMLAVVGNALMKDKRKLTEKQLQHMENVENMFYQACTHCLKELKNKLTPNEVFFKTRLGLVIISKKDALFYEENSVTKAETPYAVRPEILYSVTNVSQKLFQSINTFKMFSVRTFGTGSMV